MGNNRRDAAGFSVVAVLAIVILWALGCLDGPDENTHTKDKRKHGQVHDQVVF